VIVGGGQAGLSTGYHLAGHDRPFVILDAGERIGDSWRKRWDSLRLFIPARFSGLAGMPFPAPAHSFPTKDAVADYLEAYAVRFDLPVRTGVRLDGLSRNGDGFVVTTGERRFEAKNVVVAMASYQVPSVPPSPVSSTPASSSSMPATTATRPSCETERCSWWVRATPAPRSRSRSRTGIRPGCRAGTPTTSRSESRPSSHGTSSCR
jgi:glycine/D-amino acid oxidase-like deaminating enzyme